MNDPMSVHSVDQLETLIDAHGLRNVLESLAIICYGKAEHLRANWQDDVAARVWESDARKIDKCAARVA